MDWKTGKLDVAKVSEYAVEALLLGGFTYLFAYQNYLLYRWHRGLSLPSKLPFLLIGIVVGIAFFIYELEKGMKVESRRELTGTLAQSAENGGEE